MAGTTSGTIQWARAGILTQLYTCSEYDEHTEHTSGHVQQTPWPPQVPVVDLKDVWTARDGHHTLTSHWELHDYGSEMICTGYMTTPAASCMVMEPRGSEMGGLHWSHDVCT
jgi:hypothetical protein